MDDWEREQEFLESEGAKAIADNEAMIEGEHEREMAELNKLLLTPEQRDKAWEGAFEKPVYLDHEPTADELLNLRLDCVAQAQLAKALKGKETEIEQAQKLEGEIILLQQVERLGFEISNGKIVKVTNQTEYSCDIEEICDANFEQLMRLIESLIEQAKREEGERIIGELEAIHRDADYKPFW